MPQARCAQVAPCPTKKGRVALWSRGSIGSRSLPLSRPWVDAARGLALAALVGVAYASSVAHAATRTKANNALSLNDPASWGGTAPGLADIALWNSTAGSNTTNALGANLSWQGIQVTTVTSPVVIPAGNTLTLGTSGIDMSSTPSATNNVTLNNNVILGANQNWNVSATLDGNNVKTAERFLTVGGVISGSNAVSLTKTGSGTLILTGANTFAGGITVSGDFSVLRVSDTTAYVGDVPITNNGMGTGDVTLQGGILQLRANGDGTSDPQTLTYSNDLLITSGVDINVDRQGGTSTGKTLAFDTLSIGSNQLNVSGANGYGLAIDAVTLNSTLATFLPTSAPLTLGSIQNVTGDTTLILDGTNTASSVTGSIDVGFSADTISVTKQGTGTWTLSGSNTYNRETFVTSGTLIITNNESLGNTDTGTQVVSGGTLFMQGDIIVTGESLMLVGSGAGSAGALRSAGDNEWANDIVIDNTGGAITITRIASDSGLLTLSGAIQLTSTPTDDLVFQGAGNISVEGIISGDSKVTKGGTGAGTVTFAGSDANDYTGLTTVSAGTLNLAKPEGIDAVPGNLTLSGTGIVTFSENEQIADSAIVTVGGTANFNVGNANETIGALTVTGGSLSLGRSDTVPGVLTVGGDITASGTFTASNTGSGALAGYIDFGGTGRAITMASGTFVLNVPIKNGTVTKNGAGGTLRLGSTVEPAITTGLLVESGTVNLAAANQIADTASVTVGGGATAAVFNFNNGAAHFSEALTNFSVTSNGTAATGSGSGGSPITFSGTLTVDAGATAANGFTINSGGAKVSANTVTVIGGNPGIQIGSNTAGVRSELLIGSGGLSLNGGLININSGANGARVALNGPVSTVASATGSSIAAPAGSGVRTLDLNGGIRTFDIADGAAVADLTVSATVVSTNRDDTTTLLPGGGILKTGDGTLSLTVANTYDAGTTIRAGTIRTGVATALGTAGVTLGATSGNANAALIHTAASTVTNTITLASGTSTGSVTLGSTGAVAAVFSSPITLNRDLTTSTDNAGGSVNLSGAITGTGNLLITSSAGGTTILSNTANSFNGSINIQSGTLQYNTGASAAGVPVNVANKLTGPGTFAKAGGTLTAAANTAGSTFANTSTGVLALTNNTNDSTGQINLIAGVVSISNSGQLGTGSAPINFAGGAIFLSENVTSNRGLTITSSYATVNAGPIGVAAGRSAEFTGAITGTGNMRFDTGFAAGTTNTSLGAMPNNTLILSGSGNNGAGTFTTSGYGILSIRGGVTIGSDNATLGNLSLSGNSVLELGAFDMTRAIGTGANQIQLTTSIGAGFAAHGADRVVALGGLGSPTALAWGATNFLSSARNFIFGSSTATHTVDFRNALNLNSTTTNGVIRVLMAVDGPATREGLLSGVISKSGSGTTTLAIEGTGAVELSNGNNSFNTTTIIRGGSLLVAANAIGTAGNTVLGAGSADIQVGDTAAVNAEGTNSNAALLIDGAFQVSRGINVNSGNASTATIGGFANATSTFSGALTLNKATRLTSVSTGANKVVVSGAISGASGSLTKIGAGIAELSNAAGNSYAAGTNVTAGLLLVNNTSGSGTGSGSVSVEGGTLGGTGIISGAVTVGSTMAGTIAPGNSAGVLRVNNAINFGANSTLSLELTGTAPGVGGYDQLKMTNAANTISLTSGAAISLSLSGFNFTGSEVFYVLTREDAGAFTTLFAGTSEGGTVSLGGDITGTITYHANWNNTTPANSTFNGGNDVAIYNVVPEPNTLTMLAGSLGLTFGLQRFRRRRAEYSA